MSRAVILVSLLIAMMLKRDELGGTYLTVMIVALGWAAWGILHVFRASSEPRPAAVIEDGFLKFFAADSLSASMQLPLADLRRIRTSRDLTIYKFDMADNRIKELRDLWMIEVKRQIDRFLEARADLKMVFVDASELF